MKVCNQMNPLWPSLGSLIKRELLVKQQCELCVKKTIRLNGCPGTFNGPLKWCLPMAELWSSALRELTSPIDIWKYPVDAEDIDLLMGVSYPKGINECADPCMFTELIHLELMQLSVKTGSLRSVDQATDEVKKAWHLYNEIYISWLFSSDHGIKCLQDEDEMIAGFANTLSINFLSVHSP